MVTVGALPASVTSLASVAAGLGDHARHGELRARRERLPAEHTGVVCDSAYEPRSDRVNVVRRSRWRLDVEPIVTAWDSHSEAAAVIGRLHHDGHHFSDGLRTSGDGPAELDVVNRNRFGIRFDSTISTRGIQRKNFTTPPLPNRWSLNHEKLYQCQRPLPTNEGVPKDKRKNHVVRRALEDKVGL